MKWLSVYIFRFSEAMSPDPAKFHKCGSTQIGLAQEGGDPSSSFGCITAGCVVAQYAKSSGELNDVCQDCGHNAA